MTRATRSPAGAPGIRIHAIDIVQPPGIGISPIADIHALVAFWLPCRT
jgi:hypothetical protein